ncbi:response regulator, partial [bacterium]|nr:response regulator [bacterium]
MKEQSILVADSDPKNLQILKDHLENAGFLVTTVTNGLQAWELVQQTQPTLILSEVILPGIDGMKLLEKITSTPQTMSLPLIFLTSKRELQDRVLSFKMGAKDYLVKPLHVKEVIAHIKMVLARLERQEQKTMVQHAKLEGDLAELDISALIENFGIERKTGVLSVTHSNGKKGQIYFHNGCVINAEQGNFKREKAVYQMFNWSSGQFSMVFRDVTVKDEISTSNLGLLLQGLRQQEMRKHYLQQIPDINAPFLPTSTFKSLLDKRKLSRDLVRFISLLDGKRKIQQILDTSTYDEVRTLELILRLYKQGFIKQASNYDGLRLHQPKRPSAELPGDEIQSGSFVDEVRPKPPVITKPTVTVAKAPAPNTEPAAIIQNRPQPKRVTRPVKPRERQNRVITDSEPAR